MIIFVGTVIAFFARRYLLGDSHYRRFFQTLGLFILSLIVMATANHLLIDLVSCGFSNLLLVRLIIHKSQWQAAKASGYLGAKTLFLGFGALGLAFILLYNSAGLSSIQDDFENALQTA
jgi:NAD(P)H-quinone oxidoreductase subunit 5